MTNDARCSVQPAVHPTQSPLQAASASAANTSPRHAWGHIARGVLCLVSDLAEFVNVIYSSSTVARPRKQPRLREQDHHGRLQSDEHLPGYSLPQARRGQRRAHRAGHHRRAPSGCRLQGQIDLASKDASGLSNTRANCSFDEPSMLSVGGFASE